MRNTGILGAVSYRAAPSVSVGWLNWFVCRSNRVTEKKTEWARKPEFSCLVLSRSSAKSCLCDCWLMYPLHKGWLVLNKRMMHDTLKGAMQTVPKRLWKASETKRCWHAGVDLVRKCKNNWSLHWTIQLSLLREESLNILCLSQLENACQFAHTNLLFGGVCSY